MTRKYDFETIAEARTYLSSVVTDITRAEGQREFEQLYQEARIRERDGSKDGDDEKL